VAIVDDDPDFLQLLQSRLQKNWHVNAFDTSDACKIHLQMCAQDWAQDFEQLKRIAALQSDEMRRNEQSQHTIAALLAYWRNDTTRQHITRMVLADYAMPLMGGIDLFKQVPDWVGGRYLLTGLADDAVAVDAFNRGLISQFITKQSLNLDAVLRQKITDEMDMPLPQWQAIWGNALSHRQQDALQHEVLAQQLRTWSKLHWIEYAVIAQPFGILGLSKAGMVSWLQMEFCEDLSNLAELALHADMDAQTVADIQSAKVLVNVELTQRSREWPSESAPICIGAVGVTPCIGAFFGEFTMDRLISTTAK
jgi:CheY-like chemotaxis protein